MSDVRPGAAGSEGRLWQVRPALPEEEGDVVTLWETCGLLVSYNDPRADFQRALRGTSSTVLVGSDGKAGPILGSVMAGHDGHRGWLYYVATAPTMRGKGLGRAMVRGAEAWLTTNGIERVQLLVRETNASVVRFYEAVGYETVPRTVMARWLR